MSETPVATPAPKKPATEAFEDPAFTASVEGAREYMINKIPSAAMVGSVTGASVGYYIGDMAALYSVTYGLGLGLGSTAFYCGVYGLRCVRKADDMYNYAISGCVNGAWIVTGLAGYKRGILGAALGAAAGALVKVGGDAAYSTSRTAWIAHRKFTMDNSKEKILDIRKPAFHPKDSQLPRHLANKSIIPTGPGGGRTAPVVGSAQGQGEKKEKQGQDDGKKATAAAAASAAKTGWWFW
jgi:hypothetical protein